MNITAVVENVVKLFGETTPHRHTVDISGEASKDYGIVHLPTDAKLKRKAIAQHFNKAKQEYAGALSNNWVDGAQHIHGKHQGEPVNHIWAHHWLDHESEDQQLHVTHRFTPL